MVTGTLSIEFDLFAKPNLYPNDNEWLLWLFKLLATFSYWYYAKLRVAMSESRYPTKTKILAEHQRLRSKVRNLRIKKQYGS